MGCQTQQPFRKLTRVAIAAAEPRMACTRIQLALTNAWGEASEADRGMCTYLPKEELMDAYDAREYGVMQLLESARASIVLESHAAAGLMRATIPATPRSVCTAGAEPSGARPKKLEPKDKTQARGAKQSRQPQGGLPPS